MDAIDLVLRTAVSSSRNVVLTDPVTFGLLDPPPVPALVRAKFELERLGLLEKNRSTELGTKVYALCILEGNVTHRNHYSDYKASLPPSHDVTGI